MRPFLSQWRAEFSLAMRQGEQLLVSVGIPLGILVFFSQIDVVRFDGVDAVDYLTPATMALAVMSTSMVSLGIGTGFDRNYGVLKRLGSTPLGRGRWLAAKVATVATIEAVSYTHLRAHETVLDLVCRLLLEKKTRPLSSACSVRRAQTV